MNGKLKAYFQLMGLTIEGNNAHGNFKGYEVSANVAILDTVSPVKIHVNLYASEENKIKIINELKHLNYKYFFVEADIYGVLLGFNDPLTVGRLLKRMPEMMDEIFAVFTKYEAKGVGYCPICGEELKEESKKYRIEWSLITMDKDCVTGINAAIEEDNKNFNEIPNNYLKGTIGALIGAVVGVIAFVVLFFIGFISAITSLVSIVLGVYLYKKFGGKPNAVMIVIVSVLSIVSMLLGVWGIYIFAAEMLAGDYGFASTGIQAFNDMMTVAEFKQEFSSNLSMTIIFTIVGVVFEIVQLAKSIKRQGAIK